MKKNPTIVVHNGDFHPDDVFAVATLFLVFGHANVMRSRDPKIIEAADIVADVGGVYDETRDRFDHHQINGAGMRPYGIPYASFGLVWKKYGLHVSGSLSIAEEIDRHIVAPVDAMDNGVPIWKPLFPDVSPYTFDKVIFAFRPTWKEGESGVNEAFLQAVGLAKSLLEREISRGHDYEEGVARADEEYRSAADKRVIVLSKKYPWERMMTERPEPLYVMYPNEADKTWHLKTVWANRDELFKSRKDFPEAWAGKQGAELAAITGVPDAVFCHTKRFLVVAKSKEGAMALANLALAA